MASFWQVVAMCLAFTWLNPHVYLDTVILIGTVASQFGDRAAFAIGAITASFMFFFGLGYGARLLQPWFAKPVAWKVLDIAIGVVMWSITNIVTHGLAGKQKALSAKPKDVDPR